MSNISYKDSQVGLGIRPELFTDALQGVFSVDFFEAHSENYFTHAIAKKKLLQLRADYPISLHSVALSLGRADNLDYTHMQQLKLLIDACEPTYISEHLAWSTYQHHYVPDLLPLPLTEETLAIVCAHVQEYQEYLGQQIFIENPSNYMLFSESYIGETDFLNTLAKKTGCGLLIDVNNIYVSAQNCQHDAKQYINDIQPDYVRQFHLAGHTKVQKNNELVCIDTHNQLVDKNVWDLFAYALTRHPCRVALLEWDSEFPETGVLQQQCDKIHQYFSSTKFENKNTKKRISVIENTKKNSGNIATFQATFWHAVLQQKTHHSSITAPYQQRLSIYQNNSFQAIFSYLKAVFPAVCGVVGEGFFQQMGACFFQNHPPKEGDIHQYGENFSQVLTAFPVLADLPYLSDMIRLEWALHVSYLSDVTMKGYTPLVTENVEQDALLNKVVQLNASIFLVSSDYPLYEIHKQSLPEYQQEVSIQLEQGGDIILVYQHQQQAWMHVISRLQFRFLRALSKPTTLLENITNFAKNDKITEISEIMGLLFEYQCVLEQNGD